MYAEMRGKVALVTGGSQGIGKATAAAFAREGAKVVIASRTRATGEQAAAELCAEGGEARWVQVDVSQAGQVERLVQETLAAYGRLDYAFNNGGSGGHSGWTAEIEEAEWDKTIDGFLKSAFLCMKYEIQAMLEQGGVIVNNSSVDGKRAFPWDPAYSAAKHGVLGLTKSAAVQYIQRGVRINAVCPGWIHTPATEGLYSQPEQAEGVLHQPAHWPVWRAGGSGGGGAVAVFKPGEHDRRNGPGGGRRLPGGVSHNRKKAPRLEIAGGL